MKRISLVQKNGQWTAKFECAESEFFSFLDLGIARKALALGFRMYKLQRLESEHGRQERKA